MSAAKRLEMIQNAWANGRTVSFSTHTRTVRVTAKTAQRWEEYGQPFARVAGDTLQIIEGRRYVDAMGCAIRIG